MTAAIRTEHLTKNFFRVNALSRLNLEIPSGAIYALVGPNGAGKTTAIKVLMNIFGATSGTAEVLGRPSSQIRGQAFREIGYVSENQQLPDWMTVDAFLAYLRPFYPTWDSQMQAELVRQFDLPGTRRLKALSRGMRMKTALAGALAFRPKLIVLDEPFGGLDPLVRDELIESMLDCASEATILISSHDLAEIETFASHVGYLEQGSLRWSEELATLMARFREVEIALDGPAAVPQRVPNSWMQLRAAGAVVQLIESHFDELRTPSELRTLFPSVKDLTFTPMSLRSIFLAMAKAGRQHSA